MTDDYYHFVERAHQLRGEHTHRTYRLGDRVRVHVARADLERRQVDLLLTDVLARTRSKGGRGERSSTVFSTRRDEAPAHAAKRKTARQAGPGAKAKTEGRRAGTRRKATRPGRREREAVRRDGAGRGPSRGGRRR
jgi:ribonuclease R